MTSYGVYSLVLALVVFAIFTVLFSVMISYITKSSIRIIGLGGDDEEILKQRKYLTKKPSKSSKFERVFSALLSVILIVIFIFALCISCTDDKFETGLSSLKIVKSASMATKNEKNEYLFENDLNDQFDVFDLVITRPLPAPEELELYDIIVYERDDMLVIHRIVGIEPPNEKHSEWYFKLQGDAISQHDVYPVLYSQMHAIYEGERIPYIGSFITFVQSPAGWLCFILVMIGIIAIPIIEKLLLDAMRKRLALLDAMAAEAESVPETVPAFAPIPEPEAEAEPIPEPVIIPAPAPAPTPVRPVEIPTYPSSYRPISKPRLIEERPRATVQLERRKPIEPSYRIVPLDVSVPRYPEPIRHTGELAENDNMRLHVVPITLDGGKKGKAAEMKPITRYVRLNVSEGGAKNTPAGSSARK